jgi:hypothetical protein
MDCSQFQQRLPLVMSGDGADGERNQLADHATGCVACRRTLQDWEEAQRSLETTLSAGRIDPRKIRIMAETLYAGRFGTAIEVGSRDRPPVAPPLLAGRGVLMLVGAGLGLLVGYLVWGQAGGGQLNQLNQQVMLAQMYAGGGFGPGGGRANLWLPGFLSMGGAVSRDLFGVCLVIWLCRTRLWGLFFPLALPRGIQMGRLLALPLLIAGVLRILATAFVLPSLATMGVMGRGGWSDDLGFTNIYLIVDAVWRYGFWLFLFLLIFSAVENLTLLHLKTAESAAYSNKYTQSSDRAALPS